MKSLEESVEAANESCIGKPNNYFQNLKTCNHKNVRFYTIQYGRKGRKFALYICQYCLSTVSSSTVTEKRIDAIKLEALLRIIKNKNAQFSIKPC